MKKWIAILMLFLFINFINGYSLFSPLPPPPSGTGGCTGNCSYDIISANVLNASLYICLGEFCIGSWGELNATLNDLYVKRAGDNMTGNLNMSGNNITNVEYLGGNSPIKVTSDIIMVGTNITAVHFVGSGKYLTDINASNISEYSYYSNFSNYSLSSETSNFSNFSNIANTALNYNEQDPHWTANYTNMLSPCGANNYVYGINPDGSFKCRPETGGGSNGSTILLDINATNIKGSDCSGSDGDINRQYTITELKFVNIDNSLLHPVIDYTYSGTTLTFLHNLWDDQDITLWTSTLNITSVNYLGSDCSGSDGDVNRLLPSDYVAFIGVDNQMLHPNIDYILPGGNIQFLKPIWNDMVITIWKKTG